MFVLLLLLGVFVGVTVTLIGRRLGWPLWVQLATVLVLGMFIDGIFHR